jgi:hypothetical protein
MIIRLHFFKLFLNYIIFYFLKVDFGLKYIFFKKIVCLFLELTFFLNIIIVNDENDEQNFT